MMCAWKKNENIDFNFADFQLEEAIDSENEYYIKSVCRDKIRRTDTFILLIGTDTWQKTVYVKAEVEVAIEKGCRLIGVNLDHWRSMNPYTCPPFFLTVGALFVPFSPQIVARALDPAEWQRPTPPHFQHYWFLDRVYKELGYEFHGNTAKRTPTISDFWRSILDGSKK
jgi:hypothetical protein